MFFQDLAAERGLEDIELDLDGAVLDGEAAFLDAEDDFTLVAIRRLVAVEDREDDVALVKGLQAGGHVAIVDEELVVRRGDELRGDDVAHRERDSVPASKEGERVKEIGFGGGAH
jgi:hypothetical protein